MANELQRLLSSLIEKTPVNFFKKAFLKNHLDFKSLFISKVIHKYLNNVHEKKIRVSDLLKTTALSCNTRAKLKDGCKVLTRAGAKL